MNSERKRCWGSGASVALGLMALLMIPLVAVTQPLASPGDVRLRNDLQLLNDSRIINVPLTAWPLSLGDIHTALTNVDAMALNWPQGQAVGRVRTYLRSELETGSISLTAGISGAVDPRVIRSFENTPRDDGEIGAQLSWLGERFSINLSASHVANPFDDDAFRLDGTYVGVALGNWALTAGWQDRWWGPSRDGSLILSTNARPTPGVALQRNLSTPFKTKWLSWLGPWTLASFMTELDDTRTINDAWLFGVRGSTRPPKTGLEIGISRAAQWCGDDRPCDGSTFVDLLLGNDNRGVNVSPEDEPGNQLGGFDIRWSLPRQVPVALYMQWIGEDGRGGGGAIGAWMRQVGVESWGTVGSLTHRTHFEVSDSMCRAGGFGFSGRIPDCAYEHSIYNTGYRYRGRALGHSSDGDSLSYSLGSTLVQSAGHSWNISLRYMEINKEGAPSLRHTLTSTPRELTDLLFSHTRHTQYGQLHLGVGYGRESDLVSNTSRTDVAGFVRWSSR